MCVREETKPMLSGIDPVRPNPLNSMLVTLPEASQTRPAQEHRAWSGIGGEASVHVHPDDWPFAAGEVAAAREHKAMPNGNQNQSK